MSDSLECITPAEYWSSARCPRCRGALRWFDDGDSITTNDGTDHWSMCCDTDEAFCTNCKINLPVCPIPRVCYSNKEMLQ